MFNHPDVLHQLVADRHREAARTVEQGRYARQRRQVQRAGRRQGRRAINGPDPEAPSNTRNHRPPATVVPGAPRSAGHYGALPCQPRCLSVLSGRTATSPWSW